MGAARQAAPSPASYAGTESSSPIEHTFTTHTPPHHHTTNQVAQGGSRTPVNHARAEAVPTYALLASHARTSMHGTPGSHAPRLPTSGPNPQTPACLVGCPPRTRAEWEDSYKPTNQNSKNCEPGIRPLWEWGPARLKEGNLERPLWISGILMPGADV